MKSVCPLLQNSGEILIALKCASNLTINFSENLHRKESKEGQPSWNLCIPEVARVLGVPQAAAVSLSLPLDL